MNPSTRPVVQPRSYRELAEKPYRTETIDGTTPGPTEHTDHGFVLPAGVDDLWRTELDGATPDDMDLEVYRREGGTLVEVGCSGNLPGSKEQVELSGAKAGTYVLRVINHASASPTYTLTESFFDARTRTTDGTRERYVFTCEKRGRGLQRERVFIDRGPESGLRPEGAADPDDATARVGCAHRASGEGETVSDRTDTDRPSDGTDLAGPLTPASRAVAGLAFAVAGLLGTNVVSTAVQLLALGPGGSGEPTPYFVVMGVGTAALGALALLLVATPARGPVLGWPSHLARAAAAIALVDLVAAVVMVLAGLVHGTY